MRFDGKIVVVTGGSSGIGLATCRLFIKEGAARVYLTGRRQAELQSAAQSLGPKAVPVQSDISKASDMDRLYDMIRVRDCRVDIVFANAGIAEFAPLGTLSEEHIDNLLNVNIKGVIWTVQKALPLMSTGGAIVLNASIVASKGFPTWSVYSATKAAIRSFARTWSSDLKGRGIRINVVSPGVVDTPTHEKAGIKGPELENLFAFAASMAPLERIGSVEDIAKVVAFLASDESSFTTGSEIFADGGLAQV